MPRHQRLPRIRITIPPTTTRRNLGRTHRYRTAQRTPTSRIPRLMKHAWMKRANCKGTNPDWFHPPEGKSYLGRHGKELCQNCDVQQQCLDFALSFPINQDQFGIYGGYTPRQRRLLRRKLNPANKTPGPKPQTITGLDDTE